MLFNNLRKHTKTIVWAIAIIIVPAFVLWNIGSAVSKRRSGFAGKIFDKRIPWKDFVIEKRAARNEAWLKYGDQSEQAMDLDEQTWTRLILLSKAKQAKITVSNKELLDYIQSLPTFRFAELTPENYNMIIARIFQQTPSEFESGMRNSLIISKFMAQLVADITASEQEVKDAYTKEFVQADITYALINPEDFLESVSVDNAEQALKVYYEENKESFKKPEQVDVQYIEVPIENFKTQINITDEEIKKYYEENKETFRINEPADNKEPKYKTLKTESSNIQQILTEKAMNARAFDLARQIVNKLYADVEMQAVASEFNLEAKQTGPFSMLEEIPNVGLSFPFLKAAFSLGIGEVSEIIQTPTGFYILKPIKKLPPYIPLYENISEDVILAYKKSEAKKLAKEHGMEIRNQIIELMKNENLNFIMAAEKLGLKTKSVKAITRAGYIAELGYSQDFTNAVFDLKKNEVSNLLNTPSGLCITTLDQLINFNPEQFEQEKENYTNKVLAQKKNLFLNNWFSKVKTEANPQSFTQEDQF
ncbi:MAG: peptidyl-prolyl cis-trans isomerase [Candidatus Omnitrophica bacterium]|nr:peptidyl-prolyl cis-trans isomerase [Candidatus Omnitrophota bacterium]